MGAQGIWPELLSCAGTCKLVPASMAQFIIAALVATLASLAQAGAGGLRSEPDGEVAEPYNTTENATFAAALEAAILDFEEHIEDNATLSAKVGVSRCSGKYMGIIEALSPGCLAQCQSRGVCGAMDEAIGAYGGKKKDTKAAQRAACHHKGAFACLLEGKHRSKCGRLIGQAGRYGIPTTQGALNHRCR